MTIKKYTIEDCQKIAELKGGKCLSTEVKSTKEKLLWQCKNGHQWYSRLNSILYLDRWCENCIRTNYTIIDMKNIAEKRNGECLSIDYYGVRVPLQWKCNICGNIWESTPKTIQNGSWCPKCRLKQSNQKKIVNGGITIEQLQLLALKRNGLCLQDKYEGRSKKYKWQCSEGHQWIASYDNVKRGSWCPICNDYTSTISEFVCRSIFEYLFNTTFPKSRPSWLKNSDGNQMELDGYNEELKIAFEYQGMQHYVRFNHFHKSDAIFDRQQILDNEKKELCFKNNINLICISYKIKIDNMQKYIVNELLNYGIDKTNVKKMDYNVSLGKMPIYTTKKLNQMKVIAEEHNGKFLSSVYLGGKVKRLWQCQFGHTWEAIPNSIVYGKTWCPFCHKN